MIRDLQASIAFVFLFIWIWMENVSLHIRLVEKLWLLFFFIFTTKLSLEKANIWFKKIKVESCYLTDILVMKIVKKFYKLNFLTLQEGASGMDIDGDRAETIITFYPHHTSHRKLLRTLQLTCTQVWFIIWIVSSRSSYFSIEK